MRGKIAKEVLDRTYTNSPHTHMRPSQSANQIRYLFSSSKEDRDLNVVYYIIDRIGASSVPYQDTFSALL